jgi:hypothetical protein
MIIYYLVFLPVNRVIFHDAISSRQFVLQSLLLDGIEQATLGNGS